MHQIDFVSDCITGPTAYRFASSSCLVRHGPSAGDCAFAATMETYFEKGNQPACNGEEAPSSYKGCGVDKAEPPVWDVKLNNLGHPVNPGTDTSAFMTESCTGCHSSAGIYTSYDPATGINTNRASSPGTSPG